MLNTIKRLFGIHDTNLNRKKIQVIVPNEYIDLLPSKIYNLVNQHKKGTPPPIVSVPISFERGLAINGLSTIDFRYLLNHYTNHKVSNFDDLNLISEIKDELISSIDNALLSDRLAEENITSRETAIINLKNLKLIIICIDQYNKGKVLKD
ncbi:hypothetical protein [Acinetobacter baumannii]|uniref:hypothetical protein n=1 Tax=Acinetobacter baumannii TaxID=470 RepID=UPI0023414DC3|nr:hypothetical protein [Acinetobacter baumannii]MDC4147562.1 hypothetical protein [Acinetobacter baumannii]